MTYYTFLAMKPKPNHIIKDSEIVKGKSKIDSVISPSTQTLSPSILSLKFPFDLKDDQIAAVVAGWKTTTGELSSTVQELEKLKSHSNVQGG